MTMHFGLTPGLSNATPSPSKPVTNASLSPSLDLVATLVPVLPYNSPTHSPLTCRLPSPFLTPCNPHLTSHP